MNVVRLNEKTPADEWLAMSNQGTDRFLDLLICAAGDFETTESQEELLAFLEDRKDVNGIASGTAGFDMAEMPWREDSLEEDVDFLIRVAAHAGSRDVVESMPYEVNMDIVLPWLRQFAALVSFCRA